MGGGIFVVVIVSPWAMLSTKPKLAYPRRQENEAMSAGLVRAFRLLLSSGSLLRSANRLITLSNVLPRSKRF